MLVKYHIITGFIASILIWLAFPQIGWFYATIIFLSSVLIDFDHYLIYVYKKKDWSLRNAYSWFIKKRDFFNKLSPYQKTRYKLMLFIFHGLECWIILALLIFAHKIFLFVLIGIAIHMVLDFIDIYQHKTPVYIKISQIYTNYKNKGKKSWD